MACLTNIVVNLCVCMPYWERFHTQNRPSGPWWTLPCLGGDQIPAMLCLPGDGILAMPCLTGEKFSRYTMLDRRLNYTHVMLYRIKNNNKNKNTLPMPCLTGDKTLVMSCLTGDKVLAMLGGRQNSSHVMLDRQKSWFIPCWITYKELSMKWWINETKSCPYITE